MRIGAIKQLTRLLSPYKKEMLISLFLSLLPAYFTVWNPYLIGRLIDEGIGKRDSQMLLLLGLLILFSRTALALAQIFVNYCLSSFGLQILVDYRDQLLARILKYPTLFFDKMSSGKLTTRLTSDINSLQELFSSALVPLIGNVFLILGIMVGMFLMNWKLALLSYLVVPLLIGATLMFHDRIRRRFGFMRQAVSALNSFAGESFSGSRDLQVFNALEMNQKEFERYSTKLKSRNTEAVREYAFYNPLVPFLTSLMEVMILGYGSYQVVHGAMSVGEVVAFLAYASYFGGPVRDFAEKYATLQQALASVDRLLEVASHKTELDSGTEKFQTGVIEFKNVEFSYEKSSSPAVSNLNFLVHPGEKIALLGETGSGKTTTCSLLMRFYEPTQGEVTIGEKNIQQMSLDSFRSSLGWVSQDVVLFSQSLRENLRFYNDSITDHDIWDALDLVQLKTWAEDLPLKLDQPLSERGSAFSSGQRQLLSLARALIHKPKILIFDEATSYIDSQTEWRVQQAIEKLWDLPQFSGMT
ncbi:MAG: transporter related protein, partial [Bacteriovoracaceae bacterium]|nr:transporter related protein [Bacteriovoracaceae bacterium]